MRRTLSVALFTTTAAIPSIILGQATPPSSSTPASTIVVTGRAETRIPADRAVILIKVETHGTTAVLAAGENARIQKAVLDALHKAGVQPAQVRTVGYSVGINWRRDERGGEPKRDGYAADNSIQVQVTELDRIGALVDVALAAGATSVGDIEFSATNTEETRRAVLAAAIANARGDAEVMAKASGGTLGRLLEVSSEPVDWYSGAGFSRIQVRGLRGFGTAIASREIEVSAVANTRWSLIMP